MKAYKFKLSIAFLSLWTGAFPLHGQVDESKGVRIELAQPIRSKGNPVIVGSTDRHFCFVQARGGDVYLETRSGIGIHATAAYGWIDRETGVVESLVEDDRVEHNDLKLKMLGEYDLDSEGLKVFYSAYDGKSDRYYVYARKVNAAGTFGPFEDILSLPAARKSRASTDLIFSADRSKFMAFGQETDQKSKGTTHTFAVYSRDGKMIWEGQYNWLANSKKNRSYSVIDYRLSNKGVIYFLVRVLKEREKNAKAADYYDYTVVAINTERSEVYQNPMEMDRSEIIQAIGLRVDEKGQSDAVVFGALAEEKNSRLKGTFRVKVSEDGSALEPMDKAPFNREFIKYWEAYRKTSGAMKTKDGTLRGDIRFRESFTLSDGSTYDIYEDFDVYVSVDAKTGAVRNVYYEYNDLFIQHLDREGQSISTAHIPKKQRSKNDRGFSSGYFATLRNDVLYVFFNDDVKNGSFWKGESKKLNKVKLPNKANFVKVEYHKDGSLKYDEIQSLLPEKFKVLPHLFKLNPDNPDEILIFGFSKKRVKGAGEFFGTIQFLNE